MESGHALLCPGDRQPVFVAPVQAEMVNIAVAANFAAVAEDLATLFEAQTDHEVALSFASTGQL